MLLDEGRRLCDYRFREINNRRVVGMLLGKFVENSGCDFVFVRERRRDQRLENTFCREAVQSRRWRFASVAGRSARAS